MNKRIEIIFLVGLPGSGKTTYAKRVNELFGYSVYTLDNYRTDNSPINQTELLKRALSDVQKSASSELNLSSTIVIDGLFTTNRVIYEAIDVIKDALSDYDILIEFHHWNEDREVCKLNDINRRPVTSQLTISCMPFDNTIYTKHMKTKYEDSHISFKPIIEHEVEPHIYINDVDVIGTVDDDYITADNKTIVSDTWSVCSESPISFKVLDTLLDKVCPNLSYKDYKYIKDTCISTNIWTESDYYSEYTLSQWTCDIIELFKTLEELGYLK